MPEESFIDFKCPYCGTDLSYLSHYAGTTQACADCLESVVIPLESCEVGGKLPRSITTQRLLLRRVRPADWKDLLEVMSDPELFQYVDWNALDEEGVVRWIESDQGARLTQTAQGICFGIELLDGGKLIGNLTVFYRDEAHRQAGFRIFINRNYQRQGYGTEAVGGLIDFGFAGIHVHRIAADCDSRNQAARRMLEKAGLRQEGEFLKDAFRGGEWVNTAWYAVLQEEYETWEAGEKGSALQD